MSIKFVYFIAAKEVVTAHVRSYLLPIFPTFAFLIMLPSMC